jgi:hypothetical protein
MSDLAKSEQRIAPSCEGDRTKLAVFLATSIGCAVETSCNAVGDVAPAPVATARPRGDVPRIADVALVLGFAGPTSLARSLAGASAAGSRAVALVTAVTRVGTK